MPTKAPLLYMKHCELLYNLGTLREASTRYKRIFPISYKALQTKAFTSDSLSARANLTSLFGVSQQELHSLQEFVNITGNIAAHTIFNNSGQFRSRQGHHWHTYGHRFNDGQR